MITPTDFTGSPLDWCGCARRAARRAPFETRCLLVLVRAAFVVRMTQAALNAMNAPGADPEKILAAAAKEAARDRDQVRDAARAAQAAAAKVGA
jgi:hypothetical protein